jgi:hypothetical protein
VCRSSNRSMAGVTCYRGAGHSTACGCARPRYWWLGLGHSGVGRRSETAISVQNSRTARFVEMRRISRLIAVLAIMSTVVVGAFCAGYRFKYPSDLVEVKCVNLPNDVDFACIVSRKDDVATVMPLYLHHLGPFVMHPASYSKSYRGPIESGNEIPVAWRDGAEYGVVVRRTDGTWQVVWFGCQDVRRTNRDAFGGRGRVRFNLARGQVVPLSDDEVRGLGLEKVGAGGQD